MTYVTPTASDLKMRLPEFVTTDDSAVEFAISEALRSVDETWLEGDYALAIIYLAAHIISIAQKASAGGGSTREIASEKIGPISITYAQSNSLSNVETTTLAETIYGRRYKALLRRNNPPVLVVR